MGISCWVFSAFGASASCSTASSRRRRVSSPLARLPSIRSHNAALHRPAKRPARSIHTVPDVNDSLRGFPCPLLGAFQQPLSLVASSKACWKDYARSSPCGPRPADGPDVPWQASTTWTRRAGGRYWKRQLVFYGLTFSPLLVILSIIKTTNKGAENELDNRDRKVSDARILHCSF